MDRMRKFHQNLDETWSLSSVKLLALKLIFVYGLVAVSLVAFEKCYALDGVQCQVQLLAKTHEGANDK